MIAIGIIILAVLVFCVAVFTFFKLEVPLESATLSLWAIFMLILGYIIKTW